MNRSKDDPRAKQLSTGKKKFNIDPDKVSQMYMGMIIIIKFY